ncbi:hypothetical protein BJF78_21070 [Pseudonocardia sp. CNS-139]|nr:hypothetical protein BJF78_21070 [Pseudonocardia sp. CNS-139]
MNAKPTSRTRCRKASAAAPPSASDPATPDASGRDAGDASDIDGRSYGQDRRAGPAERVGRPAPRDRVENPAVQRWPTAEYEPWMRRALEIARQLPDPGAGDPPVGAVVYDHDGNEIAAAHHDRKRTGDPTAHAEIRALRHAGEALGTWQLSGCTLVTTLEPGVMGAGAIVMARIPRLVIGSWDRHNGAVSSQWDLVRDRRLNHYVEVIAEVLVEETDALLNGYLDAPQPSPPAV